jgi:hypothetical protein
VRSRAKAFTRVTILDFIGLYCMKPILVLCAIMLAVSLDSCGDPESVADPADFRPRLAIHTLSVDSLIVEFTFSAPKRGSSSMYQLDFGDNLSVMGLKADTVIEHRYSSRERFAVRLLTSRDSSRMGDTMQSFTLDLTTGHPTAQELLASTRVEIWYQAVIPIKQFGYLSYTTQTIATTKKLANLTRSVDTLRFERHEKWDVENGPNNIEKYSADESLKLDMPGDGGELELHYAKASSLDHSYNYTHNYSYSDRFSVSSLKFFSQDDTSFTYLGSGHILRGRLFNHHYASTRVGTTTSDSIFWDSKLIPAVKVVFYK